MIKKHLVVAYVSHSYVFLLNIIFIGLSQAFVPSFNAILSYFLRSIFGIHDLSIIYFIDLMTNLESKIVLHYFFHFSLI